MRIFNFSTLGIHRAQVPKCKIIAMNVLPSPVLWCSKKRLFVPVNNLPKPVLKEKLFVKLPKMNYKNLIVEEDNRKIVYMVDDLICEQMKKFKYSNVDTIDSQFDDKYFGRISYSFTNKLQGVAHEFPKLPESYYNKHGRLKNFTYINMVESNLGNKRIGTKLICNAVKDGVIQGYEGRVLLEAVDIQSGKGSPIKFYKKLGFKFSDDALDKKVDEMIDKKVDIEKLDVGYKTGMYLPLENVASLLRLGRSFEVII